MIDPNENKSGYKKTKVGWIPAEWESKKIGDMISCFSGGTPSRNHYPSFYNGNIPWIKSGELNNKNITTTKERISESAVAASSARLVTPDTLLYALYGATAGIPAFTRISATINQAILAILTKEYLSNVYLFFWFYNNRIHLINCL